MYLLFLVFLTQVALAQENLEISLSLTVVNYNELLKNNNIFILNNSLEPYSGDVFVSDSLNKIILKGSMNNGKAVGEWTHFFEDGNVHAFFNIENNKLNGEFKEYYLNNNLYKEGNFLNGEMDGVWNLYNLNGQLLFSIEYENGKVKY
jgi:antitoxin component YwqK of YwqJK toxin-antitoxin module